MFRQIWDGISQRELEKISSQVCHHIAASSEWKHAETVLAYLSFGKEISLDELIQKSLEEQKTLGVPLIEGSTRMSFRKLDSWPSRGFEINKWGIREPGKTYPVLSPGKNTLILVPGLGFSSDGKRMGRGGGFYDRYLEKADLRNPFSWGLLAMPA